MNVYSVAFTPEAEDQLLELYRYIAGRSTPETASRYTGAIVEHCAGMRNFPHRGTLRDEIRPGLRTTHFRGNAVIAFVVDEPRLSVTIIGIFYGGRNYEELLQPKDA